MSAEVIKQLKIKTGMVSRTNKEVLAYRKEQIDQSNKIQSLISNNACHFDVKQQKVVLEECLACLDQGEKRLSTHVQDLEHFLFLHSKSLDSDSEDLKKATLAINDARETVSFIPEINKIEEEDDSI